MTIYKSTIQNLALTASGVIVLVCMVAVPYQLGAAAGHLALAKESFDKIEVPARP